MFDAASAELPHKGHDHDRIVLLKELGKFVVCDGAASPHASDKATQEFKRQYIQGSEAGLRSVFKAMQKEVRLHVPGYYTTATGLAIYPAAGKFEYAQAGDSALFIVDPMREQISKLTRSESFRNPDGSTNIDNFLGSERYVLRQWDRLPLLSRTVFIICSDGIFDENHPNESVSEAIMLEIALSNTSCQQKSDAIKDASRLEDDAAVIVVGYEP